MKSKWVMSASAVFMAFLGVVGTFLPQELLKQLQVPQHPVLPLVLQLAGALYLGFAMLDWMAKESVIGGIYNRPLAVGNMLHFTVGGMALLKGAVANRTLLGLVVLAGCYVLFAVAFAMIVFGRPVKSQ